MKFDVAKGDLSSAISILTQIANTRSPLPILTNILFEVGDELLVTATNLEIGARIKVPATLFEKGTFTLLASKCMEIVSNMPNDTISFSTKNKSISISSGATSFLLQTLDPGDFPKFALFDVSESKDIQSDVLLSILDNVLFAASNDVSRFNLNSLYFSEHNNLPCVVATDGHRLAMQYVLELPVPKLTKIPKSGCDFIKKFLSKIPAQSLKIYSDTKNVVFSTDSTTITIRIIDGDYPDVGKVVPSVEPETRILVNTDVIKQSVKRVSLITDQMHKSLDIAIVGDNIEIASNNAQLGSALDSVLVNKTGADCNFVMNSAYLIDALNHVSGESCEILLTGPGKPMIFRSENATDVFSLIMPMRK